MVNICVVAARKGGVGKTTLAYELAYMLEAVLVDFEWDGDSSSRRWGYRHEDRLHDRMVGALESGRCPRPMKGHRKPDLVAGSANLVDLALTAEDFAEALQSWAGEWDREWVVVDTHPGAGPAAHGAMSVANVICVPSRLVPSELTGAQQLVEEMPDYPLVIVPNAVQGVPRASELNRLRAIVDGTPVRVAPPIPHATAIAYRKRRIAMTSEEPVPKNLAKPVAAYHRVAEFVKEYTRD